MTTPTLSLFLKIGELSLKANSNPYRLDHKQFDLYTSQ